MNHYISQYIDNELSLDEKIDFVHIVHDNERFKYETVQFLQQEKLLVGALNREAPAAESFRPNVRLFPSRGKAVSLAAAACLFIIAAFLVGKNYPSVIAPLPGAAAVQHRFVLYQEDAGKVEITGSFTDWQRVPLRPAGNEGYWEISLEVPPGEHRYSYILDSGKVLPDPTVPAREEDDFGTINSILSVEV
jgi:hypothetical protein